MKGTDGLCSCIVKRPTFVFEARETTAVPTKPARESDGATKDPMKAIMFASVMCEGGSK